MTHPERWGRYITAICNIALGSTKKENRRELSWLDVEPSTDRPIASPWAMSIDLPARATFKPWKHSCHGTPTRNYQPWKKIDFLRVLYCRDLCISYPRHVATHIQHRQWFLSKWERECHATQIKLAISLAFTQNGQCNCNAFSTRFR